MEMELLLAPLGEDGVGPDLSYEDERIAIEEAFSSSASGERAGDVAWGEVIRRIRAQAEHTRDLWLAVYLARAGARAGDLESVAEGAELLAGLLDRHWARVHPQLDEVGFQGRKSACDSLARHAEFIAPLKRVPLIQHPRLGSYSATDLERFEAGGDAEDGYGMFRAALEATDDAAIDAAVATLDRIQGALRCVDTVLVEHAGDETGTDFQPTYQVLRQMGERLRRHSGTASASAGLVEVMLAPGTAPATPVTATATPGEPLGGINSREDVIRALDLVADYYRRREPASPVPVALARARAWVTMGFMEVLADIAPDSMDDARRVLMSRKMITDLEN